MRDISKKFGTRVRQIRHSKHLSQGNVAKLLGVHPSYISSIERGVRNMSLKNIARLAKALGVSIEKLVR